MTGLAEKNLELGKLYADRGDFDQAEGLLTQAADQFFVEQKLADYLKCQNILLRMYAEREQTERINETKEKIQDLVLKEGFELNAKTYYTLALCASHKNQLELADDFLRKSLAISMASDAKEDICYAAFGLANLHAMRGPASFDKALLEVANLNVFFQHLRLPELAVSTRLLHVWILQQQKKVDEAIQLCWQAYEEARLTKNLYTNAYLTFMLASLYADREDRETSRLFLGLAKRSLDPKNYVRLSRMVDRLTERLGGSAEATYDLVLDEEHHAVIERKLGRIDFKNQFILLDLLKLLVRDHGQIHSKESLVERIWKQDYDPAVHDNKIYVNIKRLRKLIEPDVEKPRYIFRAKNGYYMSKSVRVLVEPSRRGELS